MNDYEIEHIAAAINLLRPDWPTKSLITLMHRDELVRRPRRDVCVAFAWVACETNTANPGRVLEAGPWWRAAVADDDTSATTRVRPPKRGQDCPHHPGQWADRCGGCVADRNGVGYDEDAPAPIPPRTWDAASDTTRTTAIAQARAALRQTEETS